VLYNSFDELHDREFVDPLMLVAPFMPLGGHCLLHGKRGLGKTQLAHTLAIDVALGLQFLGSFATLQGTVAYVQADMTPKLQQDRIRKLRAATGLRQGIALHYFNEEGAYDCEQALERGDDWIVKLRELEPVLVVVDTLRKSHSYDENVSNTPVAVYSHWRAIAGPRPAILYLHHDRKTNEWSVGGDRSEEFRGSGAWLDEADLGLHLCSSKAGLYLEWSKLRTCGPQDVPPAVNLRIDPDSLLCVADDPVEAFVKDACRRGIPTMQIVGMAQDKSRWGDRVMSERTAKRRIVHYRGHTPKEENE
jgi:hypothetical protein